MSRLCEELILWSSQEFRFVDIDDAYATGSSIMPQKKNPDACELVRGKSGRVFGHLMGLLTVMKGLPLAYNKDMQEDKQGFFDALDTTMACLDIMQGVISTLRVREDVMEKKRARGLFKRYGSSRLFSKQGRALSRCAWHCRAYRHCPARIKNAPLKIYRSISCGTFHSAFDESIYDYLDYRQILQKGNKKEIIGEKHA